MFSLIAPFFITGDFPCQLHYSASLSRLHSNCQSKQISKEMIKNGVGLSEPRLVQLSLQMVHHPASHEQNTGTFKNFENF